MDETVECTTCKATIDALAVFPGGICMKCYEKVFDKMTPAEQVPDFTRVLNVTARKKNANLRSTI